MKKNKLISSVMVPLLVLNLFPATAMGSSVVKYKDGTFSGAATVKDIEGDFEDYGLTVKVSVSDGKITSITPEHDGSSYTEDNDPYWNWATNGRTRSKITYDSAVKQIIDNQSTDVDAVSGATCTTNAIAEAVKDALTNAVDSSGYVLMNIPYDQFYGAEGTSNIDVDAISSATNKVGNYGKAGGAFHSGTTAQIAEDGTVTAVGGENGAHLEGVIWPVKVSDLSNLNKLGGKEITDESKVTVATLGKGKTSSTELEGAAALTEASAYSYYVLSETPDYYVVLDTDGTTPSFKGLVGDVKKLDQIDVDVTYATHWGDVQFDLTNASEVADKQVNAMVITTEDGTTGGMVHLYNIWAYNSLAWKVANVTGLDGAKITNIRYYCNDKEGNYYVYDYPVDLNILPVYTGQVTAEFTDDSTIKVAGLPEDIKNPTATVYYTTGGRGATYEYLTPTHVDPDDGDVEPDTAQVADGKIVLTEQPENEKTYTIVIGSDNYVAITVTAEYKEKTSDINDSDHKDDDTNNDNPSDDDSNITNNDDSPSGDDSNITNDDNNPSDDNSNITNSDDNQSENNNNINNDDNPSQEVNSRTEYKVINETAANGDSSAANSWKQGSDEGLVIVSEAPVDKFESVIVDGKIVDPSNYTVVSGSTRITLKKEFLDTLTVGTHDIIIRSTDGDAKTTFNVIAPSAAETPNNADTGNTDKSSNNATSSQIVKTGDNTNVWGIISIIITAIGVLGLSLKLKKKEIE